MLSRRRFLGTLSGSLLAAPVATEAQGGQSVPRIGVLGALSPPPAPSPDVDAFRQGLRDLGYIDGQSITIHYAWGSGHPDRAREQIIDLLRHRPQVLVVVGDGTANVAKQVAGAIPIVMTTGTDPVGQGLAASLARPGGNVTGLSMLTAELSAKRLELLKETVPELTRVAVFNAYSPGSRTGQRLLGETEEAARRLGLVVVSAHVEKASEFEQAFKTTQRVRASAVIGLVHPLFATNAGQLAGLALKYRVPSMFAEPGVVEAGGLLRYGPSIPDLWRRAATYVDKILKGAKAGDLPIEQPTKFELVINAKTAKVLGLTIPPTVLLRADQVIQ